MKGILLKIGALQKAYAPSSPERLALQAAIAQMEQELPFEVPCIVNGEEVRIGLTFV